MSTVRADITTSRSGPERWSQRERERVSVSVCAGLRRADPDSAAD